MNKEDVFLAAVFTLIGIVGFGFAAFAVHQEKEIFNKCTGSHATFSDAFWGNLRPDRCE
jgi:hypothetical protein